MRHYHRVSEYVEPSAHRVGRDQPLSAVSEQMRALGVRNLPVIKDGELCGVLSEADVALVEHLPRRHRAQLSVGAVMGQDLYPVAHSAPLAHVARTMADHGYGCAVVMEGDAVIGLFTASDALRVLAALLEAEGIADDPLNASEVRALVLTEQKHVCGLVERTLRAVERLQRSRDPARDTRRLRERARHTCRAVDSYLALQERKLAPGLSELLGSSVTLGQDLSRAHLRQVADAAALASVLEAQELPAGSFAQQLEQLLLSLREDFQREHELLRTLDATSNDYVITDAAAG